MFRNLGTPEIIVILIVLLVLFGGKKLPELARGLGQAGRELKGAKKDVETALKDDSNEGGEN